jgi:hypothetical protein
MANFIDKYEEIGVYALPCLLVFNPDLQSGRSFIEPAQVNGHCPESIAMEKLFSLMNNVVVNRRIPSPLCPPFGCSRWERELTGQQCLLLVVNGYDRRSVTL